MGIGLVFVVYDYLSLGKIDWIRAVVVAVIASVILYVIEKVKK